MTVLSESAGEYVVFDSAVPGVVRSLDWEALRVSVRYPHRSPRVDWSVTDHSFSDPLIRSIIIDQIISDRHAADIVIADLPGQHLLVSE